MRAAPCIERAKGGRKSGELFLPDFEIDGLGSAFIAAGISFFAGAAASRVMAFVLPLQASEGGWATYALGLALSIVWMAIGIAYAPGIRATTASTLKAAVIVSVAASGFAFALKPLFAVMAGAPAA